MEKMTNTETTKLERLEETAKRAKEANSFREYKKGTATNEYYQKVAEAETITQETIARLEKDNAPEDRIEKATYYLERYKTKLLEWYLDYYTCEASCPSIMISGGSNFPTRKKENQNARRETIHNNTPDYLLEKIKSIKYNSNTIYSDDANAVERLKEKIKKEEEAHIFKMKVNAYYKKNGTTKGFENLTDEQSAKLDNNVFLGQIFITVNDLANIRRLKQRLLELSPQEIKEGKKITINGLEATYKNIISLFDNIKAKKSYYDDTRYYLNLILTFSDGMRNYKEFLQVETNEEGSKISTYDKENGYKTIFVELTDDKKFNLIIGKMAGSGNKAVIYSILKDLKPKDPEKEESKIQREAEAKINGESIRIERNNEITRLQLFFEGIPQQETRNILKSNGFRWSPSEGAWQRLLNENSEYTLKRLLSK